MLRPLNTGVRPLFSILYTSKTSVLRTQGLFRQFLTLTPPRSTRLPRALSPLSHSLSELPLSFFPMLTISGVQYNLSISVLTVAFLFVSTSLAILLKIKAFLPSELLITRCGQPIEDSKRDGWTQTMPTKCPHQHSRATWFSFNEFFHQPFYQIHLPYTVWPLQYFNCNSSSICSFTVPEKFLCYCV